MDGVEDLADIIAELRRFAREARYAHTRELLEKEAVRLEGHMSARVVGGCRYAR